MKHTYIIAEAGVNHNGSIEMAKQLIDVAVESGADAVKFQTFKAEMLVSKNAPKAQYQMEQTDESESQFEMLKKLELDQKSHELLVEHCNERGIQFLSTAFDIDSIDLLAQQMRLPRLKIPSGEITNAPLLLHAARTGKPIILSTGVSDLKEIELALGVLAFGYLRTKETPAVEVFKEAYLSSEGKNVLKKHVVLLHCTTEYPAKFKDINLLAMKLMSNVFGLPVGYSDHTLGIAVSIAAAALGAVVVEKHFTLDRNLSGPDHAASLEPNELAAMIRSIRQVDDALGVREKKPTDSELKNLSVIRKSLVAQKRIKRGEVFTENNLTVKRPGYGISPFCYWEWLGKIADRDYEADEVIQ
ncbi:MAG: N-acetylneuraminate synthase [Firmicutes bacterium HGW-Firmicutes-14]|nr:MAG: N-acetylneuraminate synthase [Firmicutes bacterium HGW-Firmicutes-14]